MSNTTINPTDRIQQPNAHDTRDLSTVTSSSLICQQTTNALGREFRSKTGEFVATAPV